MMIRMSMIIPGKGGECVRWAGKLVAPPSPPSPAFPIGKSPPLLLLRYYVYYTPSHHCNSPSVQAVPWSTNTLDTNTISSPPPHHTTTTPPCFATTKYMHTMHLHGVHFTDNRKTRLQDAPSAGFTLQCTEVKLFCSANQFIVLHHHQALLGRVACVLTSPPLSL